MSRKRTSISWYFNTTAKSQLLPLTIVKDVGKTKERLRKTKNRLWSQYCTKVTLVLLLLGIVRMAMSITYGSKTVPSTESVCGSRHLPIWSANQPRKVYDLVLVDTELDWLEIRLAELYNVVDLFIVMEDTYTFTGHNKTLYVRENWQRFAQWQDKIRLFTLDYSDPSLFEDAWSHENAARRALLSQGVRSLQGHEAPNQGDVILVSDVDEIPRADTVQLLCLCKFPKEVTLITAFYYYSYQWRRSEDWLHPQATYFDGEKTHYPDNLRYEKGLLLKDSGWHCSSCFRFIKQQIHKVESFAHIEFSKPEFKTREWILDSYRFGLDIYNRQDQIYERVDHNEDVPSHILRNPFRFAHLLNRDPANANFEDVRLQDVQDIQAYSP